tara:strand:+ start:92 stop:517 length:426 start_codon:yes stop_codon:yes gene_type:complete
MPVVAGLTNSFKQEILSGTHNLSSGGNTLYLALYQDSANISPSTTAYTTSGEASGTGYSAAGKVLTSAGITLSGGTAYVDFTDLSWTSSSFSARGGLIYNSTQSNKSIAVLDFGFEFTSSSSTLSVTFPSANVDDAIIRIT